MSRRSRLSDPPSRWLAIIVAIGLLVFLLGPLLAVVRDMDPRDEVAAILQEHPTITALPVINQSGRLVGAIRQAGIVSAIEEETSVDIQTMVGVSADERALSTPFFAVKKRLPWLQVNLLTAFLAAAVVGLFEGLIAKFTALAVLLPVVAGQSGNAGAQALAVTSPVTPSALRGSALGAIVDPFVRSVAGGAVGLVVARRWDVFRSRWFWAGGGVAVLLFLPHLVWQQANGWPTLEFMSNARRFKMADLPVSGFLAETVLQTAPAAWLWLLGVAWLVFARAARPWRALGWCFLVVVATLALGGGKPYYLAAGYVLPFAAGAVALERWTAGRGRRVRAPVAALLLVVSLALSPFGRPVLPEDAFVRYAAALGIEPGTDERHDVLLKRPEATSSKGDLP